MTSRSQSPILGPACVYSNRNDANGIYERLYDHVVDDIHGAAYLGSSTNSLGSTYELAQGRARAGGGWSSIDVLRRDGLRTPYRSILVGEMRGRNDGTKMGALGNFYVGPPHSPNFVRDGVTCRNALVIGEPTCAPGTITGLWQNQVSELMSICTEVSYMSAGADVAGVVHSNSDGVNQIKIVTDQIYKKKAATPVSKVLLTKATRSTLNDRRGTPAAQPSTSQPDEPLVKLGACYPLHYLPDHTGPLFKQNHSTVKQLDIFDADGNPVPPWLMPAALRPGVLAMFEGSFNIWCPPGRNPIMQFVAKSIKVLGESLSEPEWPMAPKVVDNNSRSSSPAADIGTKRSSAFESFGPVEKKVRLEPSDEDQLMEDVPGPSAIAWSPSRSQPPVVPVSVADFAPIDSAVSVDPGPSVAGPSTSHGSP
ncbi:hypothetical protein CVT24_001407, partial [Panaeolus cyanescens]